MVNLDIRIEEYRSLLEEHKKNRSYIFERPILILGFVAVAMQYFYETIIGRFVLAFLIFILLFNLWFTTNRLRSDSRIVAYIQLVHEGELKDKYIGWENSLRQYRIWMMEHKKTDLEKLRLEKVNHNAIPDRIMFYPAIWVFHFVLVISIFCITLTEWPSSPTEIESISIATISIVIIIFSFYALKNFPTQFKGSIELERASWLCIFEDF